MAGSKKTKESDPVKEELVKFLNGLADRSYEDVEVSVVVPDGPMSPAEVDALLSGIREIARQDNGRVRFWGKLSELGGNLGRAALRAYLSGGAVR